jgi:hypothetical protein
MYKAAPAGGVEKGVSERKLSLQEAPEAKKFLFHAARPAEAPRIFFLLFTKW